MMNTDRLSFLRDLVKQNGGLEEITSGIEAYDKGLVHFAGDNMIQEGVLIGMDGFGYEMNELGHYEKFPHTGKVFIGKYVDIYAGTTIQRGSVSDTIIQDGTKIAGQCQIGHNCNIGKDCLIGARTIICGSATLGDHCITGEFVRIAPHVVVGNNVKIRSYCNVTKDVPDNTHIKGDWV